MSVIHPNSWLQNRNGCSAQKLEKCETADWTLLIWRVACPRSVTLCHMVTALYAYVQVGDKSRWPPSRNPRPPRSLRCYRPMPLTQLIHFTTPPRNPPNGEWRTPKCTQALALVSTGISHRNVGKEVEVPRQTVDYWAINPEPRRTHRTGRPPILNKHDVRRTLAIVRSGWNGRKLSWPRLAVEAKLQCSGQTVQRALAKIGYHRCKACKKPFISKKCQDDRVAYAKEHLNKPKLFWRTQMYGDESSFDTSKHGSIWVT